ncbi:hypothetical protein NY486_03385, partial [Enterobacter hormaechei]|nr:hypothetical protein [Enterobacter hormaechei]
VSIVRAPTHRILGFVFAGIVILSILAESAEGSGDKETFHRAGQAGGSHGVFRGTPGEPADQTIAD